MKFNFQKLRGKIISEYGNLENFAKVYGVSYQSVSMKLNNKVRFSHDDIVKMSKMLSIDRNEIGDYFFTPLV